MFKRSMGSLLRRHVWYTVLKNVEVVQPGQISCLTVPIPRLILIDLVLENFCRPFFFQTMYFHFSLSDFV